MFIKAMLRQSKDRFIAASSFVVTSIVGFVDPSVGFVSGNFLVFQSF